MKKQIRRRKAIALVLCLFMMFSITPLSYADEVVADVSADSAAGVESATDSIIEDIFDSETSTTDSDNILDSETDSDAIVDTPAGSEEQTPQYDENGNLIVPEEGAEEGDGEPVEEVIEGDVPGASCTIDNCQCPCHMELTDEMLAEGMEAEKCTIQDCACPCHPQQEVKECTCGAAEGQPHQPGCPLYVEVSEEILELYEQLMACETQEDVDAFVEELTDEQYNALCEYMLKLQEQKQPYIPETVNFTDAGPFLPPVTVETSLPQKAKKMLKAFSPMPLLLSDEADTQTASGRIDATGLETRKWVEKNNNGSFTITLEAYTTGKVTTETKDVPVDIVLVLDQSGSMKQTYGTVTRQAAMKQAVNNFIDGIAAKSDSANHQVAIVSYTSSDDRTENYPSIINTEVGWTVVKNHEASIKERVTKLSCETDRWGNVIDNPSGGTPTGDAMERASELIVGKDYSAPEGSTERKKVVILFTDGVPGYTSFNINQANKAINQAHIMKQSGVTIYSIGIFDGANREQLYGDSGFEKNSDGTLNSYWQDTAWLIGDVSSPSIPAGNRFLNYVSNNFMSATELGLRQFKWKIGYLIERYTITKENCTRDDNRYYLTPTDANELNNVFTSIINNIETSDINLGSAIVKDTVTPYFDIDSPADASEIRVYTADCTGKDDDGFTFGRWKRSDLEATVTGNTVSVDSFNFDDNYARVDKDNTAAGKKLIIEFDVTPKAGFLGGNNVPTNGPDSGVYKEDGTVVENFTVPHVNVPIPDVTVTAQNKNVYLLGTLTQGQLMDGVTATCGGKNLLGTIDSDMKAFVDISITRPDDIADGMTTDGTYTVTATVTPKAAATDKSVGTANSMDGKSDTVNAKINVFKPEVTYKDTNVWYGADAPDYAALDDCRNTTVAWKHLNADGTKTDATNVTTMIGDVPTLSYSYALPSAAVADGDIATKKDIPVQATVKIGTTNVNEYTTFQHTPCTDGETAPTDGHFLLHNHTCSLTLRKTGGNTGESYIFNISKDGSHYMTVSVPANDSIIISELPVGTYSVSEETGWAWRYSPSWSATTTATFTANGTHSATLTCTNTKNIDKWLSANAEAVNAYKRMNVYKDAASTTSHGTMAAEDMNYSVSQTAANQAAVALDAILNANMEEGELDA